MLTTGAGVPRRITVASIVYEQAISATSVRGCARMIPGMKAYVGMGVKGTLDGGYYCKTPENRPLVGPLPVDGIKGLGLRGRQAGHARGDDREPGLLETAINLADHVLTDAIGLDDGQGTFDGHAGPRGGRSRARIVGLRPAACLALAQASRWLHRLIAPLQATAWFGPVHVALGIAVFLAALGLIRRSWLAEPDAVAVTTPEVDAERRESAAK